MRPIEIYFINLSGIQDKVEMFAKEKLQRTIYKNKNHPNGCGYAYFNKISGGRIQIVYLDIPVLVYDELDITALFTSGESSFPKKFVLTRIITKR